MFIRGLASTDAAFEAHAEQFLRFHGKLHRQFFEHFLAETVDDHVHGVLGGDAALVAVKDLVFADLRRGRFVLNGSRRVLHLDVGERVRPALRADEHRVAL